MTDRLRVRPARAGRQARRAMALVALPLLVVGALVLSFAVGSRVVEPPVVLAAILDPSAGGFDALAVRERVPRTVLALVVGGALGLSGGLMQTVTRNPLADPGILGVNAGASLAVVSGIAFLGASGPWAYLSLALLGATATAVLVFALGSVGAGRATPVKLALAGAATGAALSSLVSGVLLPRLEGMTEFRFWQIGDVARAEWAPILAVLPCIVIAVIVALAVTPMLDVIALGDDAATGLGVRAGVVRIVAAAAAVVLCAAATSLAGPIAFVGLVVPHVIRLLVGSSQRWMLPLSVLGGMVLMTLADVIGRVIARPIEVESGIITMIVGAPVLVLVVVRMRGSR